MDKRVENGSSETGNGSEISWRCILIRTISRSSRIPSYARYSRRPYRRVTWCRAHCRLRMSVWRYMHEVSPKFKGPDLMLATSEPPDVSTTSLQS